MIVVFNIVELYQNNEAITLESYLKKFNIKDVDEYIYPTGKYIDNPFDYNNIEDGIDLFYNHLTNASPTYILSDSGDTDGITSATIMYQYMHRLNPNWDVRILVHRGKERGLQDDELYNYITNNLRPFLIIPDSGTNDKDAVEQLSNIGVDTLVLDHHQLDNPIACGVLINNQTNKDGMSKNGSGCLVTHKFLQALDTTLNIDYSGDLIDLTALSLVSDSMDMSEMENREYYHYGLENRDCIYNPFLKQLIDKFCPVYYNQRDISFKVIPKLNSICRSSDIELKKKLLDAFDGIDIDEMVELCEQAHVEQVKLVEKTIDNYKEEIYNQSNNQIVVIADDEMPRAYSGLIASKAMDLADGKPCIVGKIKDGVMIGSLRSNIPLREVLDTNPLVEWAHGHAGQCGVCIKECNIPALIEWFNVDYFNDPNNVSYVPCKTVVKSIPLNSTLDSYYRAFEWTMFFGKGIEEPQWHITDIEYYPSAIQFLGKNKRTLKLKTDRADIMFFNVTNATKEKLGLGFVENKVFVSNVDENKHKMSLIGKLSVNEWNGNCTNQIIVDDFESEVVKTITAKDVFRKRG